VLRKASGPECGIPGKVCCPGGTCGGGACCIDSLCIHDGTACGVGKICRDSSCVVCGIGGQPCCANNVCAAGCCEPATRQCVAVGTICGAGQCMLGGACGTCGGTAGRCCATGTTPASGQMVKKAAGCSKGPGVCDDDGNGATCKSCGLNNQPCCAVNSCADGCCVLGVCHSNNTSCRWGLSGSCKAGSCADGKCGGVNQPCCSDTCTAPNTRCLPLANSPDKTCQPCGGKDERCCLDPGSDPNGTAGRVPIYCESPYQPAIDTASICSCR
jgi:hypothetical protein